jgi:hypothetical protein
MVTSIMASSPMLLSPVLAVLKGSEYPFWRSRNITAGHVSSSEILMGW